MGEIAIHLPALKRYALMLTRDMAQAEDLVQDCMARAVERIDQFQTGTNLRAWLFTILRNIHQDGRRRVSRAPVFQNIEGVSPGELADLPRQEWNLQLREFAECFSRIPEMDQDVVMLIGVDGMNYREVADILDVPVGTVKSRLSRARVRLRQLYQDR